MFQQTEDMGDADTTTSELAIEDLQMTMYKDSDSANDVKPPRTIYEVEEDTKSALTFKIYCFFEDLHTLQSELRRTWTPHKEGKTSLIGATIITTAVI